MELVEALEDHYRKYIGIGKSLQESGEKSAAKVKSLYSGAKEAGQKEEAFDKASEQIQSVLMQILGVLEVYRAVAEKDDGAGGAKLSKDIMQFEVELRGFG